MVYYRVSSGRSSLIQRERLLVLEIGRDVIDSASAFVEYISGEYGFSKSSIWYNLNRLKEKRIVDFASKDDMGKPLVLTQGGIGELERLEPSRNIIVETFSGPMLRTESDAINRRVVGNMERIVLDGNGIRA